MKHYHLKIEHYTDILQKVTGRVFHATSTENMFLIMKSGALLPNSKQQFLSSFGSFDNGYFRKRSCVSFFDYRSYGTPHWEEHAYKCFPTQNLRKGEKVCLLFLDEKIYEDLIPWTAWKDEKAWCDRVVPWVETGYKGKVSLDFISEVLVIEYV